MASVSEAREQHPVRRYSNTAVAIHWITALFVIAQIWLGLSFADAPPGPGRTETFNWHKTVGVLILLLTFARLTYRLMNPPPPYPTDLKRWERLAGVWNHRLFYLLLIGLPIGGFIAVSARAQGAPTPLVGGLSVPTIPGIPKSVGELAGEAHSLLAWLLIGLIAVHIAAALKHQFVDHGPSSGRMPPFRPPHGEDVAVGQGQGAAAEQV